MAVFGMLLTDQGFSLSLSLSLSLAVNGCHLCSSQYQLYLSFTRCLVAPFSVPQVEAENVPELSAKFEVNAVPTVVFAKVLTWAEYKHTTESEGGIAEKLFCVYITLSPFPLFLCYSLLERGIC